jgi:hypothetical protein
MVPQRIGGLVTPTVGPFQVSRSISVRWAASHLSACSSFTNVVGAFTRAPSGLM